MHQSKWNNRYVDDLVWYLNSGKRIKYIMVFQIKWLECLAAIVLSYIAKYEGVEKYKCPPVYISIR